VASRTQRRRRAFLFPKARGNRPAAAPGVECGKSCGDPFTPAPSAASTPAGPGTASSTSSRHAAMQPTDARSRGYVHFGHLNPKRRPVRMCLAASEP
jgi:hypothetical protein